MRLYKVKFIFLCNICIRKTISCFLVKLLVTSSLFSNISFAKHENIVEKKQYFFSVSIKKFQAMYSMQKLLDVN